jgi:peroxiredoxin
MTNWARFYCAVVFVLIAAVSLAGAQCPRSGITAPDLSGTDISGKYLSLADYQGKWVYIDFWATWCGPCMRKLPQVVDLHKEVSERQDFAVISVSLDDSRTKNTLDSVTSKYGITFPVMYDGGGFNSQLASNWCVDSIPSTFLIDPNGQIYASDVSPSDALRIIDKSAASMPTTLHAPLPPALGKPTAPAVIVSPPPVSVAQPASSQNIATNPTAVPTPAAPAPQGGVTAAATSSQAARNPVNATNTGFDYRLKLLDYAPSFGGQNLHQVELYLSAAALRSATSSYKVVASWVDQAGQQHNDEYRLAFNIDPAQPLVPANVSLTGQMYFFIDQPAGNYVLELAVPSQYRSLTVTLSRYDPASGTYIAGTLAN